MWGNTYPLISFSFFRAENPTPHSPRLEQTTSAFKRMKFFGVKLGDNSSVWNLDELPNVDTLEYLEINNLASLQSSPGHFLLARSKALPLLQQLHLKNNQIGHLKDHLLATFTGLRILNMAQNNMRLVDEMAFKSNAALQILSLERNQIARLGRKLFGTLSNLKHLNLKENELAQLEDNSFASMRHLEVCKPVARIREISVCF